MDKNNNLLTRSEVVFMVFSVMLGVGILSLPADAAKIAYEDGWISVIVGGIYPLYCILLIGYFHKKFPNDNILILSKKYFGRYLGSIFNVAFLGFFIFMPAAVLGGYINVVRVFAEGFLASYKMVLVLVLVIAYTCSKGLKLLGRISLIVSIITAVIFFSPISALEVASIKNIMPIGKVGIKNIFAASKTTIFAYQGIEVMFLLYPFVKDKKNVIKDSFIGVFITILLYTWVTFISIYYLGADIVVKSYWPFLQVTESVTISVVNNYRYIFMFLWSLSAVKAMVTDYFGGVIILNDFKKKKDIKAASYLLIPAVFIVSLKFSNKIDRGELLPKISEYYLIFILIWVTTLAVLIFIKDSIKKGR